MFLLQKRFHLFVNTATLLDECSIFVIGQFLLESIQKLPKYYQMVSQKRMFFNHQTSENMAQSLRKPANDGFQQGFFRWNMLNLREVLSSMGLARQHTNSAAMTLDIVRPMHHAEFSPNYPKAKRRNDKPNNDGWQKVNDTLDGRNLKKTTWGCIKPCK